MIYIGSVSRWEILEFLRLNPSGVQFIDIVRKFNSNYLEKDPKTSKTDRNDYGVARILRTLHHDRWVVKFVGSKIHNKWSGEKIVEGQKLIGSEFVHGHTFYKLSPNSLKFLNKSQFQSFYNHPQASRSMEKLKRFFRFDGKKYYKPLIELPRSLISVPTINQDTIPKELKEENERFFEFSKKFNLTKFEIIGERIKKHYKIIKAYY